MGEPYLLAAVTALPAVGWAMMQNVAKVQPRRGGQHPLPDQRDLPWQSRRSLAHTKPGLDTVLQVLVRDNNVDQALRVLKKKMQREGIFREMRQRKAYEKPSERKTREKAEAVRRSRKAARKQAIREGLIAAPKPKPRFAGPRQPGTAPSMARPGAAEPKV